ncbi:MAG: hypothetical protein AB1625_04560 [Acidobacteriota bacterium]
MRVLLLFSAAVSGALSLTMAVFLRAHRGHAGFAQWTAGTAMVSASFLLAALRGSIPVAASVVGVNVAVLAALPLFADGTLRFLGAGRLHRVWYLLVAVPLTACLYFLFAIDDTAARTAILMAASAPCFAACAALLVARRPACSSSLVTVLAAQFGLFTVATGVRGVWVYGRTGFDLFSESPAQYLFFGLSVVLHLGITITFILLTTERVTAQLGAAHAELEARVEQLQAALSEVKTLQGLLPICASCKRIREEDGSWTQVEVYVRERSQAEFSHGLCPECLPKFLSPDAARGRRSTST